MDSLGPGASVLGKTADPSRPRLKDVAGTGWETSLTAQEVSALVYFPVAWVSLWVNESGWVREE